MARIDHCHDAADVRRLSRRRLPRLVYDYIEGGGFDEQTVAINRRGFDALQLRQRVLVDVSSIDTGVTLLGQDYALPVVLAPVGLAGAMGRRAEAQAARAATSAGAEVCHASFAICALEEVVAAGGRAPWVQLYPFGDPAPHEHIMSRAEKLGVDTIVLTVDVPVPGIRPREARRPPRAKPGLHHGVRRLIDGLTHPRWLYDTWWRGRPLDFANFAGMPHPAMIAPTPDYLARLRDRWRGNLLVKGILDPEDMAVPKGIGVDGVIVSNHGGRQLDTTSATIDALPAIAEAAGPGMTVLIDGGIANGVDILKAMAAGAHGVLVGRLWAHAVAAGGEAGVAAMLARLKREFATAMALTGRTSVAQLDRSVFLQP